MAIVRGDGNLAEVTDLYEAAYLMLRGHKVEAVECIPLAGVLACRMSFSGDGLTEALAGYFDKTACVNLYAFRAAYNQVNSLIHQAKKHYATKGKTEAQGGDA